jgi:hypothetical protein
MYESSKRLVSFSPTRSCRPPSGELLIAIDKSYLDCSLQSTTTSIMMLRRTLGPPSSRLLRAAYTTRAPRGPRSTLPRHQQPSRIPKAPESSPGLSHKGSSKVDAVSDALRDIDADKNNLLSPVHIPEDPNGVLNERHPAAGILANSSIVVQRQLELMNVMLWVC